MLKQLLDEIDDPDMNELNQVEGIINQQFNHDNHTTLQRNSLGIDGERNILNDEQGRLKSLEENERQVKLALSFLKTHSKNQYLNEHGKILNKSHRRHFSILAKENIQSLLRISFIIMTG